MNSKANIVFLSERQSQLPATCQSCMKRPLCPVLDLLAQSAGSPSGSVAMKTYHANEAVIEAGQPFNGLYMVRSGFFKSSFIDNSGELQVTGFHFPGEIFGLEGIESGRYGDTVVALDTGSLCRVPFALPQTGATPARQQEPNTTAALMTLVRLMSGTLARDRNMLFNLGRMDASRRFATFLLDIGRRMQASGFDSDNFKLCMSRIDIANYLCLALETVSRLFTQFDSQGLIEVERRELRIIDRAALQAIASA